MSSTASPSEPSGVCPAVETDGLTRAYGERVALDGVTLSVAEGEIFALLGPNGGGKTTLFRILATLLPPTSGTFRIGGAAPAADLRSLRRRMGVVFQAPGLDRKLTVRENLAVHGELFGLSGAALRSLIEEVLSRFDLSGRAGDLVETLSGGLARRAEVAKALLHRPRLLLLDEPSTGLDPGARRTLRDLLRELVRSGETTVLMTTHLYEEAEAADRIGILDRGRLVALGSPAALKAEVGGDVLAVETADEAEAKRLAAEISARFEGKGAVSVVGAEVRLEREKAHAFVPALVEAFPRRFRSVTLAAPSLEDVFVAKTGRHFRDAEEVSP